MPPEATNVPSPPPAEPHPTILFDGVCNLCSHTVQFVIARDPKGDFRFASMQSPVGKALLLKHLNTDVMPATMVLIDRGRVSVRSDAALGIARRLPAPWRWAWGLRIIPRPLRDLGYKLIAHNRYRLFGKHTACWIPTPALKQRFL